MTIMLTQIPEISEGDEDLASIDGTEFLDDDELFASFELPVQVGGGDLTFSDQAVSTAELTILENIVPIGKALQFMVKGQTTGGIYIARINFTTDSTPARKKYYLLKFKCR